MDGGEVRRGSGPERAAQTGQVAYLDHALWTKLSAAESPEVFYRSWLGLQCSLIAGTRRAVLVLRAEGPFRPVAFWPEAEGTSRGLAQIVEEALSRRHGLIRKTATQGHGGTLYGVAYPLSQSGGLVGVVALELGERPESDLQAALRQLQWGAGWLEAYRRRREVSRQGEAVERLVLALEAVALVYDHRRFSAAALAVTSELASRLGCARVAFGLRLGRRAHVLALSHSAGFVRRMNLIRRIGAAMDECIDQHARIVWPVQQDDDKVLVRRCHAALCTETTAAALTVPFLDGAAAWGAMVFQWEAVEARTPETIEMADGAAALVGPALVRAWREDRWLIVKAGQSLRRQLARLLGPGYLGRKVAAVLLGAAAAFFYVAYDDFRIAAPAHLEGEVERAAVAPFDGYLVATHARAGDRVREGTVLARLDDVELALERHAWRARKSQYEAKYQKALAEHDRGNASVLRARIAEAAAQVELYRKRLAMTRIVAPFDALIVEGDLTQELGRAVRQGETLFRLAPLDRYRVRLEIEEGDISFLKTGQRGQLVLAAMPDQRLDLAVTKVTPVTEAKEGKNAFIAEAELAAASQRLRPGMEGVAKIIVGERRLVWIWTRKAVDWLRLFLWRWWH